MPANSVPEETIDTVVIGGGQAGLTVGYYLQEAGRDFVILDAGSRVGNAWRNRWESLRLFTPAHFDGLPGMEFPASRGTFIGKDEMADFLEGYCSHFKLPVRLDTRVERVSRRGAGFEVYAGHRLIAANNVVVAMSSLREPAVPAFAEGLDEGIVSMHSDAYRDQSQLQQGSVLVVGMGNSGADITMDVAASHEVIVSGKPPGAVPFRIEPFLARNVLISIVRFVGTYVLNDRNPLGKKVIPKMKSQGGPLVRVKPDDIEEAATEWVDRIVGVENGKPVTGDGRTLKVTNVIWATGYRSTFPWLDLPVFTDGGEPGHDGGIVESEPGLYFCGLHFQRAASSETITGMPRDARRVTRHLLRHRPAAGRVLQTGAGPGAVSAPPAA